MLFVFNNYLIVINYDAILLYIINNNAVTKTQINHSDISLQNYYSPNNYSRGGVVVIKWKS